MPSAFPGMDPYLEKPDEWEGFHTSLIVGIQTALTRKLQFAGGAYRVRVETLLFIHEPPARRRHLGKADDALIVEGGGKPGGGGGTAVQSAPTMRMRRGDAIDLERHRFLEVRTSGGDQIVTVLELLSPSNKQKTEDRAVYLQKREELLRAGVNVVQIDLLRRGPRLLFEDAPPHDCDAMLVRGESRNAADVWFWSLRDRLPTLPVPLSPGDADVTLDLQAAFDATFDAAAYAPYIYRDPPEPPLSGDDAAWAAGLLKSA